MSIALPEVDLRQLRAFVVVAEEQHVGRAAMRLGIAQPPLSQQIQRLERRVGVPLLERHPRGVRLTDAGRELLPVARTALAGVADGVAAARRAARGLTGQLRVGFAASLSLHLLPRLLSAYRAARPGVELDLREITSDPQIRALHAGAIDVGIGRETEPEPGIRVVPCWQEDIVVAVASTHPLARRRSIRLGSLAREPFVLFPVDAGRAFHARLVSLCADAGFAPTVVHEATEWTTVVALVAAELGVALVPASARALKVANVTYRSVAPSSPRTAVHLCWRDADRREVIRGFLAVARQPASPVA